MWRKLHSAFGLASLVLVVALALSGAILAVYPVAERLSGAVQPTAGLTVAGLAGRVAARVPNIQALHRMPSGRITVDYTDATGAPQTANVDAATGRILNADTGRGGFYDGLKTFHRSFFLGDNGRILAGIGAVALIMVSVFGAMLLISRMGGIARVLDRAKGHRAGRLHSVRIAGGRGDVHPRSKDGEWGRFLPVVKCSRAGPDALRSLPDPGMLTRQPPTLARRQVAHPRRRLPPPRRGTRRRQADRKSVV